jgi:hypothetical protein
MTAGSIFPAEKDMKNLLTGGQQIVGDDSPVAAPPHRFRAHDGATLRRTEAAQMRKPFTEAFSRRVGGIVVKLSFVQN